MNPDLIAGRYRVVRPVGKGGMGTVWLCRDEVLGREVAVKKIGMLPGEDAPDAARALREARSSAALSHRSVVSVFDAVDTPDGGAWLIMEYVPSRTLAEIVRDEGRLDPRRAALIGAQVADGLAAAHAAGTIHRDVKPGNILVGERDEAKISDFGIARRDSDDQLTRTGLVTGTPAYFSPELARGEDPAAASDVYALGAALYLAVEGRTPYPEQRNPIALLQTIGSEAPRPAEQAGPLAGAISRMMDRDPRTRWSMADAAHALRRIARPQAAADAGTAAAAGPGEVVGTAAERRQTPRETASSGERRTLVWLVGGLVLLLAMLGGGVMMMGDSGEDESPTASGTVESTSPSPTPSPSSSPSPSPSKTATPSPTPTKSARTRTAQADSGQAMEQAVREYFSLMPGNTDAGWQRLAPRMQAQGRDSYEQWWASIDSVQLHGARAVAGEPKVDITLTYRFDDGSGSREVQRLLLERDSGRYLIADDEVLSSRSVS